MQNVLILTFVLLFCFPAPTLAGEDRSAEIQRLDKQLGLERIPLKKAVILQKLSELWLNENPSARQAKDYAQEILLTGPSPLIAGIGYFQLGNVVWEQQGLDSAQRQYQRAIEHLKADSSRLGKQYLARAWHNFGLLQQYRGDNERFLNVLLNHSIPLLESIGDTVLLAGQYVSVGIILGNVSQYAQSDVYYHKAITLLDSQKPSTLLIDAYVYLAKNTIYALDGQSGRLPAVENYLQKAREALSKHSDSPSWLDYYIWNGVYEQYFKKDLSKAQQSYQRARLIGVQLNDESRTAEILNRQYYLYFDAKQFQKARQAALEQYEMVSRQSIDKNRLIALRNLINAEEKLGNISRAYDLLGHWVSLSDSLEQQDTKIRILELEKQYNQEKQQREILQLQAQAGEKEIKLQRSRLWMYAVSGLSALLLMLITGGFILYRNKQQIAKQREQLYLQEKQQFRQQQRLSNFSAMLEGQKIERKRIAADLHDGLGGTLAGVKLKLSQLKTAGGSQGNMQFILRQLDGALDELRRIARNLMPERLLKYSLPTAIEEYCRSMENPSTKIIFQALGEENPSLGAQSKATLYRIAQELITNALKHASASQVLVQLAFDSEQVILTVEDNGKGFDLKRLKEGPGIGLRTLKSRAAYVNGNLEIGSLPGEGTWVVLEVARENLRG